MSDAQDLTIQKYWSLIHMNASAHVVRAAREVGLLDALVGGQKTFGELVEGCDLQPDLTHRTLEVLLATGLIEQYAEHYAASQVLQLLAQYDRDFGDHYLETLPQQLKAESRAESIDGYRRHNVARGWTRTPLAIQAAAILDIGNSRSNLRILEIGGGASVWSTAMAFRDARSTIVAVDHADALAEAQQMVDSVQLQSRWEGYEADPVSGELPEGPFDLVLMPEILQTQDDAMAVTLLGRAADVTRPDGEVVVLDFFHNPDASEHSLATAIHDLELGLRTPLGRLRTPPQCSDLMRGAGLEAPQYAPLDKAPQNAAVLISVRPESLA